MPRWTTNTSAGLLIVCGAINALLSKIVYQLEAPDCQGQVKPFEKPWLQTALMFIAMGLCLPIAWVQQRWQARGKRQHQHHSQQQPQQEQQQQQLDGGTADVEAADQASPTSAAAAAAAKAAAVSTAAAKAAAVSTAAAAPAGPGVTAETQDLRQPLLTHSSDDAHNDRSSSRSRGGMSKFQEALLLCVPTGFDLAATTLMNVGLLYVAASVFQILRGAEMIFAALFAVTFLHRPLNRRHYGGVALCMAGIGCVGASRMLAGDSSSVDAAAAPSLSLAAAGTGRLPLALHRSEEGSVLGLAAPQGHSLTDRLWGEGGGGSGDAKAALLGMSLILLSQAIQAGQVTVEDHLMADLDMQPLLVVGWEGLIGSVVMLGGALPLLQALPYRDGSGFAEDTAGSWCMIKNSRAIAGALGLSTFAVLLYNIFGMYVTSSVGAAARVVLENARTLLVWLAALTLYYTHVGGGKVGEPWDSWSWLQAVGFAVFAAGAFLYSKGHKQQEEEEAAAGKTPAYSKWAVLKSTLSISTGQRVAWRRLRVAGAAVLAGVRASRMAHGLNSIAEGADS